jgi:hypothetical protein
MWLDRQCRRHLVLGGFAFASGMAAQAIEIGRLFHRRAFGAAILAFGYLAGTNGVGTLFSFYGRHVFSCRNKLP